MAIDFSEVTPSNFEKFCKYMIEENGFTNVKWHGRGGGDRGRDIVADSYEELPLNLSYTRKWIFQCKKYKSFPSFGQIHDEITKASQHKIDFWVLIIPLELTSSQIDFLDSIQGNYNAIKIKYISLNDIEKFMHREKQYVNVLKNGELDI